MMFRLRGSKRLGGDGREGTHRFDTARERMVEEQLRGRGITDLHVLAAMGKVPRHLFVEEALQERAYGDHPLLDFLTSELPMDMEPTDTAIEVMKKTLTTKGGDWSYEQEAYV